MTNRAISTINISHIWELSSCTVSCWISICTWLSKRTFEADSIINRIPFIPSARHNRTSRLARTSSRTSTTGCWSRGRPLICWTGKNGLCVRTVMLLRTVHTKQGKFKINKFSRNTGNLIRIDTVIGNWARLAGLSSGLEIPSLRAT